MLNNKLATYFCGSENGAWTITKLDAVVGPTLPMATHLDTLSSSQSLENKIWSLSGVSSHGQYTKRTEKEALSALQPPLHRAEATCAAFIPIKKSEAWWNLTQDERRKIFEEDSKHISNSMKYLPAIARKLYHSKDLGEPFDFLTWFEFAPNHEDSFDRLLSQLRSSKEWNYVSREVDIRLARTSAKT